MLIKFNNTFAEQLEGFYSACQSAGAPSPQLIKFNYSLASELGFEVSGLNREELAAIFSGSQSLNGAKPLAQVYAGHQFGGFVPQLGDGRALLLGEVVDRQGKRFDIQLKGSGQTPYSRNGDGKSALGPVLREYILSEAMYALGIPTTRALAAVTTGEKVMRTEILPGGVFTRVASSHIRIGSFQYFAARGETKKVKQLADYTIARHYPHLHEVENPYLSLLATITEAQAYLIAKWMLVGFIHGVMNTDNMTLSGETIDYGPCAFMDHYSPDTVFSSIDRHGRYAYKNQPPIAQWNLARLAECLLPIIDENAEHAIKLATDVLEQFPKHYSTNWLAGMRKKIGLQDIINDDLELVNDLLMLMDQQKMDYTLTFRFLVEYLKDKNTDSDLIKDESRFKSWADRWHARLLSEAENNSEYFANSRQLMNQVNPIYIPRNHKVEEAIEFAVVDGDYSKFEILLEVLSAPFDAQPGKNEFAQPAPEEFGTYVTFCGT